MSAPLLKKIYRGRSLRLGAKTLMPIGGNDVFGSSSYYWFPAYSGDGVSGRYDSCVVIVTVRGPLNVISSPDMFFNATSVTGSPKPNWA